MTSFERQIDEARNADFFETALKVGAKLKRVSATEWAGPCPSCGGNDRFGVNIQRRLFNCRGGRGGDVIAMVEHSLGINFKEAVAFIVGDESAPEKRKLGEAISVLAARQPSADDDGRRIGWARAVWNEGVSAIGTICAQYLASRDLVLEEDIAGSVIRFHGTCPWTEGGQTIRVPAMICAMRSISSDDITAIHRTRLSPEGRKVDRRMLGVAAGAAIKLDRDDSVLVGLHVGEGVETCLSAHQLGFRPCWAMGSSGAIAKVPLLAGIESLTLFSELDSGASDQSITECAEVWHNAGREVRIVTPAIGKDLNDALRARA